MNLAPRSAAADLRTGAPAPNDDQVFAEGLHMFFLIDAEAEAEADQQDHRSDAPHDAEHREESPHLMSPECGERLAQDLGESHGRTLDFGPWTSALGLRTLAIRNAGYVACCRA